MSVENRPKIVGFMCNWCSYAGADMAGTSRMQYPSNIRIIRLPCSGRINPLFIVKSFQLGADAVLVAGCHPGDCHYAEGNYYARRRIMLLRRFLDYMGIEQERFRLEWCSASEGKRLAGIVANFTEEATKLGPKKRMEAVTQTLDTKEEQG